MAFQTIKMVLYKFYNATEAKATVQNIWRERQPQWRQYENKILRSKYHTARICNIDSWFAEF